MSEVMVRDVVMWTKHIHGNTKLRDELSRISAEREIELVVDGVMGHWRKMADGKDGRPTTGLTPQGRMQTLWRELYSSRRGDSVSISLPAQRGGLSSVFDAAPRGSPAVNAVDRSPTAREAARLAFLTPRGWSSNGRKVTRDELYG